MLNVIYVESHYAECRYDQCQYAECRYAKCRYAECRGAFEDNYFYRYSLKEKKVTIVTLISLFDSIITT